MDADGAPDERDWLLPLQKRTTEGGEAAPAASESDRVPLHAPPFVRFFYGDLKRHSLLPLMTRRDVVALAHTCRHLAREAMRTADWPMRMHALRLRSTHDYWQMTLHPERSHVRHVDFELCVDLWRLLDLKRFFGGLRDLRSVHCEITWPAPEDFPAAPAMVAALTHVKQLQHLSIGSTHTARAHVVTVGNSACLDSLRHVPWPLSHLRTLQLVLPGEEDLQRLLAFEFARDFPRLEELVLRGALEKDSARRAVTRVAEKVRASGARPLAIRYEALTVEGHVLLAAASTEDTMQGEL